MPVMRNRLLDTSTDAKTGAGEVFYSHLCQVPFQVVFRWTRSWRRRNSHRCEKGLLRDSFSFFTSMSIPVPIDIPSSRDGSTTVEGGIHIDAKGGNGVTSVPFRIYVVNSRFALVLSATK